MWMSSTPCQTTSRFVCVSTLHSWSGDCLCCVGLMMNDDNAIFIFNLQVKKKNSEESSTQWTTGIAEVQLPIE